MIAGPDDRRARIERRGRDRRKPDSRINKVAPRRSLMKLVGGYAASLTGAAFVITIVGGELLMDGPPLLGSVIVGAIAALSAFVLMLGCIEQRLIEIRLELMMVNGGTRGGDRRAEQRRADGSGKTNGAPAEPERR